MKKNPNLTAIQNHVCWEKGTEAPFSGEFNDHFVKGKYLCVNCGGELFLSENKFNAGCGWPSFSQSIGKQSVSEKDDNSHGMQRIEILCKNCGSHLGHVFDDGPTETGLRYCVNSASLKFQQPDNQ